MIHQRDFRSKLKRSVKRGTGLSVDSISPGPFTVIKCPLCGESEFTSIEMASVWCDRCNARFEVYQAGDSGFSVECTWRFYRPGEANYILPQAADLILHLSTRIWADPHDLKHDPKTCWVDGCRPDAAKLTDERHPHVCAGLHECNLGEIYDWRLMEYPPTLRDLDRRHVWFSRSVEVGRMVWPFCTVTPFAIGRRLPLWPEVELPPVALLRPGQYYLLHHWRDGEKHDSSEGAWTDVWPVWYIVVPRWGDDMCCAIREVDVISKGVDSYDPEPAASSKGATP